MSIGQEEARAAKAVLAVQLRHDPSLLTLGLIRLPNDDWGVRVTLPSRCNGVEVVTGTMPVVEALPTSDASEHAEPVPASALSVGVRYDDSDDQQFVQGVVKVGDRVLWAGAWYETADSPRPSCSSVDLAQEQASDWLWTRLHALLVEPGSLG